MHRPVHAAGNRDPRQGWRAPSIALCGRQPDSAANIADVLREQGIIGYPATRAGEAGREEKSSLEPAHDRVVIAVLEGELTVKRLWRRDGCLRLLAENSAYAPLEVGPDQELVIWGVVTNVIHAL